jgi:hypothetical protein
MLSIGVAVVVVGVLAVALPIHIIGVVRRAVGECVKSLEHVRLCAEE